MSEFTICVHWWELWACSRTTRSISSQRHATSVFTGGSWQFSVSNNWIKMPELPITDNPLKSIKGCMKHLKGKYTSVELQHEATKLFAKR